MRTLFATHAITAALLLAISSPAAASSKACEAGKIQVKGECVVACPTSEKFTDASCECPPGYGKILFGGGGGECKRLACPTTKTFDPKLCDCPEGYEKKAKGGGKASCVKPKEKAKAT
jgi:hypothetical protein